VLKENFIFATIFVAALAMLAFIAGSILTIFHIAPATLIEDGVQGARILYERQELENSPYYNMRWSKANHDAVGLTRYDPDRAWPGYTLYTSGHEPVANLLSMSGKVVHSWTLPFTEAWPQPDHLAEVAKPEHIYWRKASVYPNGDLLAIYVGEGVTPWGHGMVKLDKDSNLLWKYSMGAHHDFDIMEDGRIYALIHEVRTRPVPRAGFLEPPIIDDTVVILSPDGEELDRINILDAFAKSRFRNTLTLIPDDAIGDYLHTNSIDVVTEEIAAAHPYAEVGQILINIRNFPLIALIDPNKRRVEWVMHGPWVVQHDPDMLSNGNILIFDNKGNIQNSGGIRSRVLEFSPLTQEIVWSYGDTMSDQLYSSWRASQERLPNGNTLITESQYGRLLEVTPPGEIVWEYRNPIRGGENNEYVAIACQATRIPIDKLDFLQ
jgi:hypothetical protein